MLEVQPNTTRMCERRRHSGRLDQQHTLTHDSRQSSDCGSEFSLFISLVGTPTHRDGGCQESRRDVGIGVDAR